MWLALAFTDNNDDNDYDEYDNDYDDDDDLAEPLTRAVKNLIPPL